MRHPFSLLSLVRASGGSAETERTVDEDRELEVDHRSLLKEQKRRTAGRSAPGDQAGLTLVTPPFTCATQMHVRRSQPDEAAPLSPAALVAFVPDIDLACCLSASLPSTESQWHSSHGYGSALRRFLSIPVPLTGHFVSSHTCQKNEKRDARSDRGDALAKQRRVVVGVLNLVVNADPHRCAHRCRVECLSGAALMIDPFANEAT